ncbi:MAG: hypothetical protein AAF432_11945 [Planctomycetota bacterium]
MRIPALLVVAVLLVGCKTGVTEQFVGYAPESVWTAMKAVAESPDYESGPYEDRWTVDRNDVFVDEAGRRIEIDRELKRWLQRPRTRTEKQKTRWTIRVTLDETNPPTVTFRDRGRHLPTDTQFEAGRYFRDMREILGPRPLPSADASVADVPPPAPSIDLVEPVEPLAPVDVAPPPAVDVDALMEPLEPGR